MTKARGDAADLILSALAAYRLSRKKPAGRGREPTPADKRRLIHLPSFALTLASGTALPGDPEECEGDAEEPDAR